MGVYNRKGIQHSQRLSTDFVLEGGPRGGDNEETDTSGTEGLDYRVEEVKTRQRRALSSRPQGKPSRSDRKQVWV